MKYFSILSLALISSLCTTYNAYGAANTERCSSYGVTAGAACYNSMLPSGILPSVDCISSSSGCKFANCRSSSNDGNLRCGCYMGGTCPEIACPSECPNRSQGGTNDPWTQVGTQPVWALCFGEKNDPICEYRCANGYYGGGHAYTFGTTIKCTKCPTANFTINKYSTQGVVSTTETDCYIPTDAIGTDTSGTWQFTNSCFYTK